MNRKLVTTNYLCEYFSLSRATIERLRSRGMPFHIIGTRSIRFDMEEVLEWMNKNK